MLCRNALHELDPSDPWRASNGSCCRECRRATRHRSDRRYDHTVNGYLRRERYERTDHAKEVRRAYERLRTAARIELEDPEFAAYLRGEITLEELPPLPPLLSIESLDRYLNYLTKKGAKDGLRYELRF